MSRIVDFDDGFTSATPPTDAALATQTELDAHLNDTTAAHAASAIAVTPAGNLAADDVQEALTELQTDVDTRATSAALTAKFDTGTGHDHDGTDAKKVLGTNLDSGAATNGQVATANGSGATTWETPAASLYVAPSFQKLTAATGTYNKNYTFIITSGNATAADTYSDGTNTYTIHKTVAASTQVVGRGSAAPVASGTLTRLTGTGDATLTFSRVIAPVCLVVTCVGSGGGGGRGTGGGTTGGAGGGAGGTAITYVRNPSASYTYICGVGGTAGTSGNGGAGNSTSFGASSICTATGGGLGIEGTSSAAVTPGGAGGVGTVGDILLNGGAGCSGHTGVSGIISGSGGTGGNSSLGGGAASTTGVGATGTNGGGGAGGTSTNGGGAGGPGTIIVEERYQ